MQQRFLTTLEPTHCTLSIFYLRQNLCVLEQVVFLQKFRVQGEIDTRRQRHRRLTSSPSLIELPPQPGRRTLSPVLTDGGMIFPSLFGAPGPTAITVASGRGDDVADVGRRIPAAVFCGARNSSAIPRCQKKRKCIFKKKPTTESCPIRNTYCVRLEALDEDAVKEGDDGLDRFDGGLGSLV